MYTPYHVKAKGDSWAARLCDLFHSLIVFLQTYIAYNSHSTPAGGTQHREDRCRRDRQHGTEVGVDRRLTGFFLAGTCQWMYVLWIRRSVCGHDTCSFGLD